MAVSSTPTLSSPGLGSGLNVNDIVDKLMAAESVPLQTYDKKTASFQSKLSAIGSLSGAIGVFQSALGGLTNASAFNGLSTTPGDTSVLSATAGAKAVAGNYNINVTQLAQAQSLTTSGLASKSSADEGAAAAGTEPAGTVGCARAAIAGAGAYMCMGAATPAGVA